MRKFWGLVLAAVLALSFGVGSALADTVVDPQIFVQQSTTLTSALGGDPNTITNTGAFGVGVAGNFTLQNPLLIIVGVYNGNGTPTISFSGCPIPAACPAATVGTYGLTANFVASFTTGVAYATLGLNDGGPGPGDSESFVNWSAGDVANGFAAPNFFKLYAFAVNTNLTSGTTITLDESGAANGSYIIAYDCRNGTGSSTGCATNGDVGQTPFTNAGLIGGHGVSVPEPGSLLLLGSGLAGLGLWGWKNRRSVQA